MAELVLVLGDASSGKTTSLVSTPSLEIEGLPPNNTAILDVIGKGLPLKGWKSVYNKEKGNYAKIGTPEGIMSALDKIKTRKDIKYIVIDDYQYILSYKFMDYVESGKTSGNAVFEQYNKILLSNKNLFDKAKSLREDQVCFIICHSEKVRAKDGFDVQEKMKSIGQATDKYLTPEGMVNIILFAVSEMKEGKPHKYFLTQTDGEKAARSPVGMFEDMKIKNDMGYVAKKIEEFYSG